MIDKIKAEIEKNNEIEWMGDTTQRQIYEKCLKWAEELQKEIEESLSGETITIMNIRKKIEKAFHGGGEWVNQIVF